MPIKNLNKSKAIANEQAASSAMKRGKRALLSKASMMEVFNRFQRNNPNPQGELHYVNDFTLLVAVVLSAQATDTGVNKATRALFDIADTPQKMLALGEVGVIAYIKTIGLYQSKAKNVIKLCEKMIMDFSGEVPKTREELETLAGVGRKTANVVLNIAFGLPTIAVDTHLFRVSNRLGLAQGKTPLSIELQLEKRISREYLMHAHHWLILHGRYICKATKPSCASCLVKDICTFDQKTIDEKSPF